MGKLLRLQDYILITAAFAGEIFEEVRLIGGLVPSAMKNRYGFVPSKYKKNSYLTEVSEMLSTGDIQRKVDKKGRAYLELTSVGKKKFKRRFRLFYKSQKWDGYFMVLIFDIPEDEKQTRQSLRRKFRELGFGMLQKSVWISPYHFEEDLREFLVIHGLGRNVFVLSAKNIWAGNLRNLAKKVWKLKNINSKYKRVIKRAKKASSLPDKKKDKVLRKTYEMYLETLASEPLLPKELLPNNWARDDALKALNEFKLE